MFNFFDKHSLSMSNYFSLRAVSRDTKVPTAELSELAKKLNLGQAGAHKNSPRRLSGDDFDKLATAAMKASIVKIEASIGRCKNQVIKLKEDKLKTARDMGRLHSLAQAMSHPAANKLKELHALVTTIDREQGQNPAQVKPLDVLNVKAKTDFLNAFNRHSERLDAIMLDVGAKL
jgi:hypothetical protein